MRYILITLLILSFLSCGNDNGMIPTPRINDAFYENVQPDLIWDHYCSNQGTCSINAFEVIDNRIVMSLSEHKLRVYDTESGMLLQESELESGAGKPELYSFELQQKDGKIYVIDKQTLRIFIINSETGALEDTQSPLIDDVEAIHSTGIMTLESEVYYFRYHSSSDNYSFNRYNYITNEEYVVNPLDSLNLDDAFTAAITYSPSMASFYTAVINDSNDSEIVKIDRQTGQIETLLTLDGDANIDELVLKENILVFNLRSLALYGLNINSKSVEWINESRKVDYISDAFIHLDELYLNLRTDLFRIDPGNGVFTMESPNFCEGSIFDVVPNKNLVISAVNETERNENQWEEFDLGTIYDLTNGQRLVEWEIDQSISQDIWFRDIQYHESNDGPAIFIATENHLYKYDWPLEN